MKSLDLEHWASMAQKAKPEQPPGATVEATPIDNLTDKAVQQTELKQIWQETEELFYILLLRFW